MSITLLVASHSQPVDFLTRILSTITTLYTFVLTENPLLWKRRQGKNKDADARGPYYVHDAPLRQVEVGKGIITSLDLMKSAHIQMTEACSTLTSGRIRSIPIYWSHH